MTKYKTYGQLRLLLSLSDITLSLKFCVFVPVPLMTCI